MLAINPACAEQGTPIVNLPITRKELVEQCLRHNSYLALKNLSCDDHDGVVVLRGCLPSYYLKQVAQEVVAHLEGVERIDNQIEVVIPACRSSWH